MLLLSPLDRLAHQHAPYTIALDHLPIELDRFSVTSNQVELKLLNIDHQRKRIFTKASFYHRKVLVPFRTAVKFEPNDPSTTTLHSNCTDPTCLGPSITKPNCHCQHARTSLSPAALESIQPSSSHLSPASFRSQLSHLPESGISTPTLFFESVIFRNPASPNLSESGIANANPFGIRNRKSQSFVSRVELLESGITSPHRITSAPSRRLSFVSGISEVSVPFKPSGQQAGTNGLDYHFIAV